MTIAGRTILLTGASRGIGAALLDRLIENGATRIIAVARNADALDAAIARHGAMVTPMAADLSDPQAVRTLIAAIRFNAPELSVLINNAGTQLLADLVAAEAAHTVDDLAREIELNFTAAIRLIAGLMPILVAQPSAMIVNMTSGLALAPKQSSPVYCATKAGMRSFTKALRYQAADRAPQLRVIEALPPLVDTDMTRGRGRRKISADACADQIIAGMLDGKDEIYVGKSRLLRAILGLSPTLAERIMRNG
jgi:uncharacterized oxidoreductase